MPLEELRSTVFESFRQILPPHKGFKIAFFNDVFDQVITAGKQPTRVYHSHDHFENVATADIENPHRVIAGFFHDAVYQHVDKKSEINPSGFTNKIKEKIDKYFTVNDDGSLVVTNQPENAPYYNAALTIFGMRPGQTLNPYEGQNEFLSAVYAAEIMEEMGLDAKDVFSVITHIAGTIPFQHFDYFDVLADKLTAVYLENQFSIDNDEIVAVIDSAVAMANFDVKDFSSEFDVFRDGGIKLLFEAVGTENINNREAVKNAITSNMLFMEGLLGQSTRNEQSVFHNYNEVPTDAECEEFEKKARINMIEWLLFSDVMHLKLSEKDYHFISLDNLLQETIKDWNTFKANSNEPEVIKSSGAMEISDILPYPSQAPNQTISGKRFAQEASIASRNIPGTFN